MFLEPNPTWQILGFPSISTKDLRPRALREARLHRCLDHLRWRFFVENANDVIAGVGCSSLSPTPRKINMEPPNHPFGKENDLPNLHDYVPC